MGFYVYWNVLFIIVLYLKIFQALNHRNNMLAYIIMHVKYIMLVRYVIEEIDKKGYLR